ncbi:hypothetical protein ACJMK2_037290 [Sinanodonta woodiana]|uniref:Uncharacterized protein n=1 Tax=Sinanodonta woodiana TaxID=1069815 RepID=A0ABD3WLX7_SINWO
MNSNRHAIRKANKIISMAKGVSPLQPQNVSLTDAKITTPFVKVMGFLTPSPTSKLIIERKLDVVSLIPDEISLIPDEISLVPDEISISPGQTINSSNNETTRSRNILTPAKIGKTTATTTTTTITITSLNNATSGLEILNITNPTKVHQLTFNQEIEDLMDLMGSNYAFNEYLEGMDLLDIINNDTNTNATPNSNKKDSDNDETNDDYNSISSTPPKCILPLSLLFPTTTSPPETICPPLANYKLSTNNSNPTKSNEIPLKSVLPGPSKDLILKDLIYDSPKKSGTENDSGTDTQMLEPTVNKQLTKIKVTSNPSTTTNKGKAPLNDIFKAKRYKQIGVEAPKTNYNQQNLRENLNSMVKP